jgi:hypothetical protein
VAFGQSLPQDRTDQFVLSLLTVGLAAAVVWFAHSAAETGAAGWETSMSQAARLLALVGLVIAVPATIGTLTSEGHAFYGSFSLGF